MNPFVSLRDYERFVYTVREMFPCVKSSNLVVIPRGRRTAILRGELIFECGYRLMIRERLSSDIDMVAIESYGYEIWNGSDKTAWYDSQPHPNDPALQSSVGWVEERNPTPTNISHVGGPRKCWVSFLNPTPTIISQLTDHKSVGFRS